SASGGVLVAHDTMSSSSDFLLMKITGNLKDTYRDSIYFSGWDISGGTPSAGSAIHHPGGDFKKISIPNSVFSGAGSYSKYWGVNWITGPNNKGVTEKGSSGSPLYNANGLIVGSLSFGSSGCDALYGKDYYGKISYSWNNNNHPNVQRRLKPWLDPDNTGVTSIQGMTYSGMVEIEKHNNAIQELQVFPNPSSGDNISISGNFVDYTGIVNVYNQMGQLVYAQSTPLASSFNLDLKQLNNGLYFIEIVCKKHIYKAKIMIIK
ncbi:MAG: T9SS type A sorting domain-containing protein, partial [Bacteroidales bacterium]